MAAKNKADSGAKVTGKAESAPKFPIEKLKEIKVSQYNKAMQKENELFIEEFVSNSKIKLNAEGL